MKTGRPPVMSKYQRRGFISVVLVLVISDPGSIVAAEHGIDCLARTIYFEARSEPVLGQIAVAQVVINRMRDRRWPNTVCGVVKQGGARRNQCQFARSEEHTSELQSQSNLVC